MHFHILLFILLMPFYSIASEFSGTFTGKTSNGYICTAILKIEKLNLITSSVVSMPIIKLIITKKNV